MFGFSLRKFFYFWWRRSLKCKLHPFIEGKVSRLPVEFLGLRFTFSNVLIFFHSCLLFLFTAFSSKNFFSFKKCSWFLNSFLCTNLYRVLLFWINFVFRDYFRKMFKKYVFEKHEVRILIYDKMNFSFLDLMTRWCLASRSSRPAFKKLWKLNWWNNFLTWKIIWMKLCQKNQIYVS